MSEPTKADVYVDVLFDDGLLFLVLCNDGCRAAEHVKVVFDHPLIGADGVDMSGLAVFSHLRFLAPGKHIPIFLDCAQAYFARRQRSRIKLTVSWRTGRTALEAIIHHDIRAYVGLPHVVRSTDDRRLRR